MQISDNHHSKFFLKSPKAKTAFLTSFVSNTLESCVIERINRGKCSRNVMTTQFHNQKQKQFVSKGSDGNLREISLFVFVMKDNKVGSWQLVMDNLVKHSTNVMGLGGN